MRLPHDRTASACLPTKMSPIVNVRECANAAAKEVSELCNKPHASECHGVAGCPFAVQSELALQHRPAVEACIRMGYWWNRTYAAKCKALTPGTKGVQLINATDGSFVRGPNAWWDDTRIFTFTRHRWPFPVSSVHRWIGVSPSDSYKYRIPDMSPRRSAPLLQVARAAPAASGQMYNRSNVEGGEVIWPGTGFGLFGVPLEFMRTAYADSVPWTQKINKIVWRGSLRGCKPNSDDACRNRDADPTGPPFSQASRWVAWKMLHVSRLADVAFTSLPTAATHGHLFTNEMQDTCAKAKSGCLDPAPVAARLRPVNQTRYKIILVIDGEAAPSNKVWPFLTESVVMAPASAYETIADIGLQPWVHYVPTKIDFSDAEANAKWCFTHSQQCQSISAAGRAHMQRLLARESATGPLRVSSYERLVETIIVAHLLSNAHLHRVPITRSHLQHLS